MATKDELRARLTQASTDDLEATFALYSDSKNLQVNLNCRGDMDAVETVRRIERAMAEAIRKAQSRGEILTKGENGRHGSEGVLMVKDLFDINGHSSALYKLFDGVSEELFDQAIDKCRADGSLSRASLSAQIQALRGGAPVPPPPPPTKVRPTARGRRSMEHMAIQMDALARGVEELDPGEVNRNEMYRAITKTYADMGVIKAFLRKVK